jgi:integrase
MSRRRAKLPAGITVRCGCRTLTEGADGKPRSVTLGARCPRLAESGHGSYGYRISAGLDESGRQREVRKTGFSTLQAAQAARAHALVDLAVNGIVDDPGITVGQFLESWLDQDAHLASLRPSTRSEYVRYTRKFLIPRLGRHRLTKLTGREIRALLDTMAKDGAGEATRRLTLATLRCALDAAVHANLIPSSPAIGVKAPKPSGRGGAGLWSLEQFDMFLTATSDHRLRPMFELTARLGLRRGEVCGLRWEDVDLVERVVTVRRSLVMVGSTVREGAPKTSSGSDREIPFGEHVADVLEQWKATQDADRQQWGDAWRGTGRLFTREDGSDLRPDVVGKLFTRLSKEAGLPPMRFHDLRHLSASAMIAAGVALEIVSKLLGHSSIGVTSGIYSHLLRPAGVDAAARTDAFWASNRASDGGAVPDRRASTPA